MLIELIQWNCYWIQLIQVLRKLRRNSDSQSYSLSMCKPMQPLLLILHHHQQLQCNLWKIALSSIHLHYLCGWNTKPKWNIKIIVLNSPKTKRALDGKRKRRSMPTMHALHQIKLTKQTSNCLSISSCVGAWHIDFNTENKFMNDTMFWDFDDSRSRVIERKQKM